MYRHIFKRLIDVLLTIIGIPIFVVIFVIVAPIIILEDKGPVFYNAPRLGKNGKVFTMYKFRSMKVNAPDIRNSDGSTFNAKDDPRMTRIGRFLRNSSLDEVPQMINVLKGDMSVIGPRPDLPEHYDLYNGDEKRKLEIRPGITGYSQAYYRNEIPWRERIQCDIYYIDNMTMLFDLKILFKTVISVLSSKSVYVQQQKD